MLDAVCGPQQWAAGAEIRRFAVERALGRRGPGGQQWAAVSSCGRAVDELRVVCLVVQGSVASKVGRVLAFLAGCMDCG